MEVFKKGTAVQYRTRWDRATLRAGTVGRITLHCIWIGCHCFHRNDVIGLREVK